MRTVDRADVSGFLNITKPRSTSAPPSPRAVERRPSHANPQPGPGDPISWRPRCGEHRVDHVQHSGLLPQEVMIMSTSLPPSRNMRGGLCARFREYVDGRKPRFIGPATPSSRCGTRLCVCEALRPAETATHACQHNHHAGAIRVTRQRHARSRICPTLRLRRETYAVATGRA
jgi:hypothetical protein